MISVFIHLERNGVFVFNQLMDTKTENTLYSIFKCSLSNENISMGNSNQFFIPTKNKTHGLLSYNTGNCQYMYPVHQHTLFMNDILYNYLINANKIASMF